MERMKKHIIALMFVSAAGFALGSCTDMESLAEGSEFPSAIDPNLKPPEPPEPTNPYEEGTPEYVRWKIEQDAGKPKYVALREFKATPGVPQVFVWFDNWSGRSDTGDSSLRAMPDSVTIISNWGGHPKFYWEESKDNPGQSLSDIRRADMEYAQKVYGSKVVVTLFSAHVGDDMQGQLTSDTPDPDYAAVGNSSDPEVIRPGIKKYAKAIYDAVIASGYDGYDWDFEPDYSGQGASAPLWYNPAQAGMFVEELSYWFGTGAMDASRDRGDRPMPEKRLLFLIDGEVHDSSMKKEWMTNYVDYFVQQAYGVGAAGANARVQGIVNQLSDHIAAGRLTTAEAVRRSILTENFESYASTGGGVEAQSSLVCDIDGTQHQVGGFGIYRVGFDYAPRGEMTWDGSANWYWLRRGISNIYNVYRQRQSEGKDKYPN